MTEKELMHYGIPGMRWGVRRGASRLTRKIARAIETNDRNIAGLKKYADKKGATAKSQRAKILYSRRLAKIAYLERLNNERKGRNPESVAYLKSPEKKNRESAARELRKGAVRYGAISVGTKLAAKHIANKIIKNGLGGDNFYKYAGATAALGAVNIGAHAVNAVATYKKYKKAKYGY